MAEQPNLEELVKAQQAAQQQAGAAPHGKEQHDAHEEPKKSALENVVTETGHMLGSAFKLGLAGAIPFTQATLSPHLARDTYAMAGAQIVGDATTSFKRGQKFTAGNALESAVQGTLLTNFANPMFSLINKIPTNDLMGYVTKGAAWGGIAYPIFFGIYQTTDYLIKNITFKGLGDYLKENYWKTLKKAWYTLFPISLLNIFFVPAAFQLPVGAALSYLLTLFGAPKKGEVPEDKKRDSTPTLVAASRATYNIGRAGYGFYEVAGGIASSLRDFLYKLTGPGALPSPAPAPAGAHPAPHPA